MLKPIKRHKAIQTFSHDHYHGLLFSSKIRQGLKQKIALERLEKYAKWFWKNHLETHFILEEEHIFPILGTENKHIERAFQEHKQLKQLFFTTEKSEKTFSIIEKKLVEHIRFEERILFQEIEAIASDRELELIEKSHPKVIINAWQDKFWSVK